jgi:hypothetical protein
LGVDFHGDAQAVAMGAGAKRAVEGKEAGIDFLVTDGAIGTGGGFAVEPLLLAGDIQQNDPGAQLQGGAQAVGEAGGDPGVYGQPVHYHFNGMLFGFGQGNGFIQILDFAVDASADVTVFFYLLQPLLVFTLPAPYHRGQNLDFGIRRQGQDFVGDLLDGLAGHGAAALVAERVANPGKEKPEIIINFGDRAHRGTGIAVAGLLLYGNRRGQAFNIVHIGLFHQSQELAGVGGKGFHIPALAFGVDGVKGQTALTGTGKAGHHHQFMAGDGQVYVPEVVLPGPFND